MPIAEERQSIWGCHVRFSSGLFAVVYAVDPLPCTFSGLQRVNPAHGASHPGATEFKYFRISCRRFVSQIRIVIETSLQRGIQSFKFGGIQVRNQARLFILLGLAISAGAAPVTTDLWDSSQAGFTGPTNIPAASGSFCGLFGNIFGGVTQNSCGASDSFNGLGFGDPASKLVLRWGTAETTIGSFSLFSPTNFADPNGEIVGFRLFTVDGNNVATQIFEQLSIPASNDGLTPLISANLNTPATSNLWQVEFLLQNSTQGAPIFKIIELDGFAPSSQSPVPEPATNLLFSAGILAFAAIRRSRN